jgi:hypothetical protein
MDCFVASLLAVTSTEGEQPLLHSSQLRAKTQTCHDEAKTQTCHCERSEAIHLINFLRKKNGLLRRFAPRSDEHRGGTASSSSLLEVTRAEGRTASSTSLLAVTRAERVSY